MCVKPSAVNINLLDISNMDHNKMYVKKSVSRMCWKSCLRIEQPMAWGYY